DLLFSAIRVGRGDNREGVIVCPPRNETGMGLRRRKQQDGAGCGGERGRGSVIVRRRQMTTNPQATPHPPLPTSNVLLNAPGSEARTNKAQAKPRCSLSWLREQFIKILARR